MGAQGMVYLAGKDLVVGVEAEVDGDTGEPVLDDDGRPVTRPLIRRAGEVVPEAHEWPDLRAYIATGQLILTGELEETPEQTGRLDQLEAAVRDLANEVNTLKAAAHTHDNNKQGKAKNAAQEKNDG